MAAAATKSVAYCFTSTWSAQRGRHWIANQEIPKGHVLFEEKPTLSLKPGDLVGHVSQPWALALKAQRKNMTFPGYVGNMELVKASWNQEDEKELASNSDPAGLLHLYAIMVTMPLNDSSGMMGFYPKLARINHHCEANAAVIPQAHRVLQVVAQKIIPAGEEITIRYMALQDTGNAHAQEIRAVRRYLLRKQFGFCLQRRHN